MAPRSDRKAHEWLELVERSGLVVTEVPLHRHFPDGPGRLEPREYQRMVGAWERFRVDPNDATRRRAWQETVLHELLAWPGDRLLDRADVPEEYRFRPEDVDETLVPSGLLLDGEDAPLLGLWTVAAVQGLDRVERRAGHWKATPQAKLERWMRGAGVSRALLTNGERFRLVHVPPGLSAGWMEWDAGQWIDERATLAGFRLLLSWGRVSGTAAPGLAELLRESEKEQTELTDRLGEQVRNAVEALILALDRADHRAPARVLSGIAPDRIYQAAVYVVMRLVFLLFAEERNLLPHGNLFYDEAYGVGRLLHLLQDERRRDPEAFQRAEDAWPRLLALFRLVFHGSGHPDLTLPAYGGDLFDPQGSDALAVLENPALQIPNPDVHAILQSLTVGQVRVGRELLAQRFSYRTLDVEHVGYVYEGLLDHRAARAGGQPMVKLRNGTEEALPLTELEGRSGEDRIRFLAGKQVLGGDQDRIRSALDEAAEGVDEHLRALPHPLMERLRPWAGVIQTDEVAEPGHLYLTTASSRRATGTHYTPVQYTRAMVQETLDPLVYVGEDGKLEEPLRLRSPRELLALKVADPAMGSGAFLVQVVRYLGEKLTETWFRERERHGEQAALYLPYAEPARDREDRIPLPAEREDAELWARRLVAERCVYGVDRNPLAVEMAKLSLWLVTLDREKPFSFLDHALRTGDSLVGIHALDQLRYWDLAGKGEMQELFAGPIADRVDQAVRLRRELEGFPVVQPEDVRRKAALLAQAGAATRELRALADLLVGPSMATENATREDELRGAALLTATAHLEEVEVLEARGRALLGDLRPFHWPLEFPEVFEEGGFHAVVGNPPFMGGQKLTGELGRPYREYLVRWIAGDTRGSADLVAYFFLRSFSLLRSSGGFGLLAVNTISEGDTRQVGLERLVAGEGVIHAAHPNEPWPNAAVVVTSRVHVRRGAWRGRLRLGPSAVDRISPYLTARDEWSTQKLAANAGLSFQGSIVLGTGFLLEPEEARCLIEADPRNNEVLFPYLNGQDLNQNPDQVPSRWAICFWDWSEEAARQYPEPFRIVEERVKPQRQERRPDGTFRQRKPRRERWWQFAETTPALYHAIGRGHAFERHPEGWGPNMQPLPEVIVCSLVSKHLSLALVPNDQVFAHRLCVFATDRVAHLAFLSSAIHDSWARHQSSTLRVDINYSPADAFQTLPFPEPGRLPSDDRLPMLGREYHDLRRLVMAREGIGLTHLYNRLHDPEDSNAGLDHLRDLQAAIDRRVLELYGWDDIDLAHDFREVPHLPENDRLRFAIAETARLDILDRLGRLNRERHEAEVAEGLHDRKKSGTRKSAKKSAAKKAPTPKAETVVREPTAAASDDNQVSLFEYLSEPAITLKVAEPAPGDRGFAPAARVLDWLRNHPGWHGRSDVTGPLGLTDAEWREAIQWLEQSGQVERKGIKRGTRYRAALR